MSSRKYSKKVGQFVAKNGSGDEYTIIVTQEFLESRDLDGNVSTTPLLKSLDTVDGHPVNFIEKGKYYLVLEEIDLTSDDPAAM